MIGVIGGTGITGSQLVAALKARAAEIRCIVRDPDAAKAKLGNDVELVRGDLSDTSSLESAMSGIDTLYILCGHSPMLQQLEINALEAAKKLVSLTSSTRQVLRKAFDPTAPLKSCKCIIMLKRPLNQVVSIEQ